MSVGRRTESYLASYLASGVMGRAPMVIMPGASLLYCPDCGERNVDWHDCLECLMPGHPGSCDYRSGVCHRCNSGSTVHLPYCGLCDSCVHDLTVARGLDHM